MKGKIKTAMFLRSRKLLTGAPEHSSTGALVLVKVTIFVICTLFLTRSASGVQTGDLVKDLSHPDWNIRYQAALTLGKKRSKGALTPLIKSLSDSKRIVRDSAALALTRIGGKRVEEEFLKGLFSGNNEARSRAALALGRMKVKRAVEPLLKLLHDKSWLVRWSTVLALGKIGAEEAVPGLEAALKDGYYDGVSGKYPVREAAGSALARIKDRKGENLACLESDLRKNPEDVEIILALSEAYLGKKKERKAIRLLEKLMKLNPPNGEYRARARFDLAYGYGQIGEWGKSQRLFRELVKQYPDSKDVDKALYSLGVLNYRLGDEAEAARNLRKLIDRYPGSKLVDKAKKLLGETEDRK